ncbi:MAG TPA: toll/interleukin-1 receptor domain-containing protein [Chthoniobacterales bacterium]|nr:toll/interleukin-1 receptor domain-containing protein [Chthoniobacterales bacterium]
MKKKNRRSFSEILLDKLQEFTGGEGLIGNTALRRALGWSQARYNRIKWDLINSDKVVVGKGKGGSIGLKEPLKSKSLSVFIAYSHADEQLKNELVKHLRPLEQLGLVEAWHDQKIKAGDEWDKSISKNLARANIVLLLVSIDFINSKYCTEVELAEALALQEEGQAIVIPVILRACLWHHTSFAKFQAVPRDGKAVCSWENRDEAFLNAAELIKQRADHVLATR